MNKTKKILLSVAVVSLNLAWPVGMGIALGGAAECLTPPAEETEDWEVPEHLEPETSPYASCQSDCQRGYMERREKQLAEEEAERLKLARRSVFDTGKQTQAYVANKP